MFAAVFFATVFLAAVFETVGFRAAFFATACLMTGLFATAFFAAVFLATDFFADFDDFGAAMSAPCGVIERRTIPEQVCDCDGHTDVTSSRTFSLQVRVPP